MEQLKCDMRQKNDGLYIKRNIMVKKYILINAPKIKQKEGIKR